MAGGHNHAAMGRRRTSNPLELPPRVRFKHGAFYYVTTTPEGGRRWQPLGSERDKAVAEGIRRNEGRDYGTMAYWYAEFLLYCHGRIGKPKNQRGLSERTVADYADAGKHLLPVFGHMAPQAITTSAVGTYLDTQAEGGRAIRANREKAALSACFSWLMRQETAEIEFNPCRGVHRNREQKRSLYVDDADYRKVQAVATPSGRVMMGLVYRTLQRPSDVLGWRTRANLAKRGEQTVLRFTQSKTGKALEIAVTPELAALLPERGGDVTRIDEPLVQRRDGERYTKSGIDAMLRRWCKKAGVTSFGFGDLKGKGATDLFHDGVSINLICDLCGHESTRTTEIYIKARTRQVIQPNRRAI